MGERQFTASGTGHAVDNIPALADLDGFGRLRLSKLTNEWSGEEDRIGIARYSVEFEQDVPLELPVDESLSDWLRANISYDIEGGVEFDPESDQFGVDGDLADQIDLPQD